jgi:hypothetical protein
MTTSDFTLHDMLVYRVEDAMTTVGLEALTVEELLAIAAVLEPAVDRQSVDSIGNVIRLADRRR